MTKTEMRDAILAAKKSKGMTWEAIAQAADLSPEYVVSACLGMNHLEAGNAEALTSALGLDASVAMALQEFPNKKWDQVVPTDPVIYRLYEIVGVYGETIKEIIHEKFGDGIMSAIDFTKNISRTEDPKGDRVKIVLDGTFLPCKTF